MKSSMMQILLLALVIVGHCTNWTASGNFTSDNITHIKNTIDDIIQMTGTGSIDVKQIASTLSANLNDLWNPAWNVVVLKLADPLKDAVVYGYAFNDHWFWMNNYGTDQRSYIIWKDYNCKSWVSVDLTHLNNSPMASDAKTSISMAIQMTILGTQQPDILIDDPWKFAQGIQTFLMSQPANATSIVMTPGKVSFFQGRICTTQIDGKNQFDLVEKAFGPTSQTYTYLIFYTR